MKTNRQLRSSQNTGNQSDLNNWFFRSLAEWTNLKLFGSTCSFTFLIFFAEEIKSFFFFVVPLMWTELFIRFQMTHKGFFTSFILFLKLVVDTLISTHLFKCQSWIFQPQDFSFLLVFYPAKVLNSVSGYWSGISANFRLQVFPDNFFVKNHSLVFFLVTVSLVI